MMPRFRSSTDRAERIDATASMLREKILSEQVAKIWDEQINADGQGITGEEVNAALNGGRGTYVLRAVTLLEIIAARVTTRAAEMAMDEAVCIVDGRNEE